MTQRRLLSALAGLTLLSSLAQAELVDPLANTIAANPALAVVAARDGATARALTAEAAEILAATPSGLRNAERPNEELSALLRGNPLLDAVYRHDPSAALDLLTRVKQAGGTRR